MLRGARFGRALRLRAEAAAKGARAPINWEATCGPFSLPSYKAKWRELTSDIHVKFGAMNGVDPEVAPIDWAKYKNVITQAGLVEQVQKEAEAAMKDIDAGKQTGGVSKEELLAKNEKLLQVLDKWNGVADSEIARLNTELAEVKKTTDTIEDWHLEDFYKHIPGLEKELEEEFENNHYWSNEAEEKLAEVNYSQLAEKISEGIFTLPPQAENPAKVGDIEVEAEIARRAELKAQLKADLLATVEASEQDGLNSEFDRIEREWDGKHVDLA